MANGAPDAAPQPYRKFRINRVCEFMANLFPGTEVRFGDFPPQDNYAQIVETDICLFTAQTNPPRTLLLFEALLIKPDSQIERLLARPELANKLRQAERDEAVWIRGLDADSPIEITPWTRARPSIRWQDCRGTRE